MRTAGFVLVGGRSSRMGRDKALLQWRHQTLVESVAAKVLVAAGNVALVGRPYSRDLSEHDVRGLVCVPDLRPGLGPLSGIEAALASGFGDLNLIVSCDLPLLETDWLQRLLHHATTHETKCTIARDSNGQLHPLCGVYRSDCLPVIQDALNAGRLRLMSVIEELSAEHLPFHTPLYNVNTPEDWERCLDLVHDR